MDRDELKPCPMCGSGPARQPGRFTSASFSGVEVMDAINKPYVWCGTCCLQTRTCDSVAEAIAAWNTRLQPSGDGENLRQSAEYALMYLETGFVECHNCGSEVETKNLDAAYELRSALASPPPAKAEPSYAKAIEDAAKVMENLCFFTPIEELLDMTKQEMSVRTCREGASAIRALAGKDEA